MAGETPDIRDQRDKRLVAGAYHQAAFNLPVPVSDKISDYVDMAREAGDRTSRSEMVAAIIFHTDVSPARLHDFLKEFRLASADDIQLYSPES